MKIINSQTSYNDLADDYNIEPYDEAILKCSRCGDTENIGYYKGHYLCQGCIDDYIYDYLEGVK